MDYLLIPDPKNIPKLRGGLFAFEGIIFYRCYVLKNYKTKHTENPNHKGNSCFHFPTFGNTLCNTKDK